MLTPMNLRLPHGKQDPVAFVAYTIQQKGMMDASVNYLMLPMRAVVMV